MPLLIRMGMGVKTSPEEEVLIRLSYTNTSSKASNQCTNHRKMVD